VSGVKDLSSRVTHSHSQSNLSDIPYRWEIGVTENIKRLKICQNSGYMNRKISGILDVIYN
jgi:hypothetical protein